MGSGLAFLVTVVGLFIGLAMIAVLVSQNAQTSKVIQALSAGGAQLLGAAVAPVSQSNQNQFGGL